MKKVLSIVVSLVMFLHVSIVLAEEDEMTDIMIIVGDVEFTAKLYANETTEAFMERFPLDVDMSELNGNEKYVYLPETLPTNSHNPGSIRSGDLMLYGSDCLVLFYEGFNTGYSYTSLGYIENPDGLASVLSRGEAHVVFRLPEDELPETMLNESE